jgi:hypothetical protein
MHRVNHIKFLQPLLSNPKRPVFFVVVFVGFFHFALKSLDSHLILDLNIYEFKFDPLLFP